MSEQAVDMTDVGLYIDLVLTMIMPLIAKTLTDTEVAGILLGFKIKMRQAQYASDEKIDLVIENVKKAVELYRKEF